MKKAFLDGIWLFLVRSGYLVLQKLLLYFTKQEHILLFQENDGSYRGCVRVHLNLSRPINIVAGTRPPSIYDILQEDRTMEKTLTSFYMPRDAVKAIHITR